MATPAAEQFETVITQKFPGTRFGRYNCRKISGSTTYSQHSWNNARDLYPPEDMPYEGVGSHSYAQYRGFLDEVVAFVRDNLEALNVRGRGLWQVRNHYNHAHFDFWPQGHNVPPCDGGRREYRYPDGHIENTARLINTYKEEPKMNMVAFVRACYDSGHPALREADRQYWLDKAEADPNDPEFYDLFKAVLGPWGSAGSEQIGYGDAVILERPN